MSGFKGALARKLDFGDVPAAMTCTARRGRAGLRLAARSGPGSAPDRYRALEHRRRAAQIKARRLLARIDLHG